MEKEEYFRTSGLVCSKEVSRNTERVNDGKPTEKIYRVEVDGPNRGVDNERKE